MPTATPSLPITSPSTQEPVKDQVRIDITITGDKVDPNGKKVDVPVGATVVLTVRSDIDDEIHAHVGDEDGYSLEVKAGQTATGRFQLSSPGSFEVESHHLEKTIVILNVR